MVHNPQTNVGTRPTDRVTAPQGCELPDTLLEQITGGGDEIGTGTGTSTSGTGPSEPDPPPPPFPRG